MRNEKISCTPFYEAGNSAAAGKGRRHKKRNRSALGRFLFYAASALFVLGEMRFFFDDGVHQFRRFVEIFFFQ